MDRQHFPLVSIEPKVLEHLRKRVPDFPEIAFRAAVSQYVAIRDDTRLPAVNVRNELDSLADQALSFSARLHASRHNETGDYITLSAERLGEAKLVDRLIHGLWTLSQIAEIARRQVQPLVKVKPRTLLVKRLAQTLRNLGLPVTAKPQDRLVLLFAIASEAAGETGEAAPKDVVGTVRNALETLEKKHLLV